jgi:hypothetical protein
LTSNEIERKIGTSGPVVGPVPKRRFATSDAVARPNFTPSRSETSSPHADGVTMEPIPTGGLEPKLARDMEAYLTAAAERVAREHGVDTSVRVLAESPPALALGRYASSLDVDLIAVATGSESDRVARRAESSGILICPTGDSN